MLHKVQEETEESVVASTTIKL